MIKDYFDTIADESGADRKAPRTPKGVSIAPAETEVGLLERKARDAYIAELESQAAAVTDPAISREILARANRVRDALPICELFDRLRLISQAKDDLGNVSGLEGIQLRDGLDQSAQVLRDANPQPPLLAELFSRYEEVGPDLRPEYYINADSSESDRASVAAGVVLLGLDAAEKSVRRPVDGSVRARIDRAVAKAMAPHYARIDTLRKDLADFRASQGSALGG